MFKIIVYKHTSITAQLEDDFLKVKEYFKSDFVKQYIPNGIDIEFTFETTTVPKYSVPQNFFTAKEEAYGTIMYLYQSGAFLDSSLGISFNVNPKLRCIYLGTNVNEDTLNGTWKSMAHEILHCITYQIQTEKNVVIPNVLDFPVGKPPYYKNSQPYEADGNFSQALKAISPYFKEIDYFKIQEFVPKAVYEQFGDASRWFIDPRLRKLANFVRTFFGKPVVINNWHTGGNSDQSGFRQPGSTIGASFSQHRFGRAMDIKVVGMTPKAVYKAILANEKAFMAAGLTTLEDVAYTPTWNHLDIRDCGINQQHILIVKP